MKRYPVLTFFVLSYLISWTAVGILHLVAIQAGLDDFGALMDMAESTFSLGDAGAGLLIPTWLVFLLSRIVDFGPSLAGLITPFLIGEPGDARKILRRLLDFRIGSAGYAWALLLPLAIVTGAFLLHTTLGDSAVTGANWQGLATIGQFVFWVFIMRTLLGGGLGEELGWRGFVLPRLATAQGAGRASLIIGLVWTFWHLPAHLAGSDPPVNLVVQLLYTVPLSYVFTWLYYKFDEKLLPVVLLHGALNGYNAFFEHSLFPALADEDGFVIFFILLTLVVGIAAAFSVRKITVPAAEAA